MRTYKYLLVFFSFIALAVNVQAETKRDSIQQVKDMDRYVFRDTLDRECKFGDLKGYLPVSQKASLFVAADVGGGWGYANSLGVRNGVILVPAVGVSIKVSPKSAVNLSIAYTNQDIKGREEPRFNYHNYSALGFKVAFQF